MTINKHVKDWWTEDYDVKYEDFYVENAKWIFEEPWVNGRVKKILLTVALSIGYAQINIQNWGSLEGALGYLLYGFAMFTIAQFFYVIREYDANDSMSTIFYIAIVITFLTLKNHFSMLAILLFALIAAVAFAYMFFVRPLQSMKFKRHMEERMEQMEREEEEADKQSYKNWEAKYKAYRQGIPEADVTNDDPILEEAKKLFTGYTDTKEMLKSRYRILAKKYHPDNGGDEHMFQCISMVYEELQKNI